MTKVEFLYELDARLAPLGEADRQKSLEYYSEMIDDRIEDGLSEKAAVAALGSIDEIYKEIISDIPLHRIIGAKLKPSRLNGKSVWTWILIVFGFLVFGLPIIAAAFATVVSIYASILVVVVSLWAVPISLLALGAAGVVLFFPFLFMGIPFKAIFMLGAGIFSLGLVYPFFYIAKWSTKGAIVISKGLFTLIKKCIVRI